MSSRLPLDYLAVGLDPNVITMVIQSLVPQIAELTVFFSNLVTVARLERNPTVKDEMKERGMEDNVTFGFLGYPVSQAADIMFVNANLVPVGEDQAPMVELTRDIVIRFNNIYGETLNVPDLMIGKVAAPARHRRQSQDEQERGQRHLPQGRRQKRSSAR